MRPTLAAVSLRSSCAVSPFDGGDHSVNDALDGNRGGFTASDAECCDAALQILRFQRMQQRDSQPRAGGADGGPQRAGAAIDVEFVAGNPEVALRRHCHYNESFIDLE